MLSWVSIISGYVDSGSALMLVTPTGISRTCREADIKKAFRRESLKHHPDKVGHHVRLTRLHISFYSLYYLPGYRAATRRSSSLLWRRTRSCQTRNNEPNMIAVSMKRNMDGDEICNVKYNAPHEFNEPCIFIFQLLEMDEPWATATATSTN